MLVNQLVLLLGGVAAQPSPDVLERFAAAMSAAPKVEPFMPPVTADEWYTVTIANVSVGYMHTTVAATDEKVRTMEVMDVQVSRGTDTSRMAFETVFDETPLEPAAPEVVSAVAPESGGVKVMAYDQRFANSEVRAPRRPGGRHALCMRLLTSRAVWCR